MAKTNKVSVKLSELEKQTMLNAIKTVDSMLPFLLTLLGNERKDLLKMGDKTVAFVMKCRDYAKTNPELVPHFLDLNEFEKDVTAVSDLLQLQRPINQLNQKLEDTIMQAGSEAYQAALLFYNNVKGATKAAVPGAESVYNDLSQRFPGRPTKKVETTNVLPEFGL
jgi:hypothetical protein